MRDTFLLEQSVTMEIVTLLTPTDHNSTHSCNQPKSTSCFQHLWFSLRLLSNCWLFCKTDYHNTHIHYSESGAWKST